MRPHVLSWHMIPCLAMIAIAVGAAIVTGQPGRMLGAVACMLMMVVMMAVMGGHRHGGHSRSEPDNQRPRAVARKLGWFSRV